MEKSIIKRNEKGAVLLTVLCVMTVMIILISASITFVNSTTQKTYRTFQAEQAYMTASTCLESFVKEIERSTNSGTADSKEEQKKAIEAIVALANENDGKGREYDVLINGDKDIDKMGSCTIRVSKYNDQIIVITSTAKFGSETDQVAAYIKTDSVPKKAKFSNAIELCQDSDHTYNNLRVIGDISSITGKNKTVTYNLTNTMSVYGSMFFYGNVTAGVTLDVMLLQSHTESSVGSHVSIWGNFDLGNGAKITTALPKGDGYNYVNIGGALNTSQNPVIGNIGEDGYSVDVYCRYANFNGNTYKQNGNLYVYKKSGETDGGNLTKNNDGVEIWGDVFVEGNIYVQGNNKLTIHGDVTYCGKVYRYGTEITGDDIKNYIDANNIVHTDTLAKTGRAQKPTMAETMNSYVYYPEDIFMSNDSSVGLLKSKYAAFYDGTCTDTFTSIYTEQVTNSGRPDVEITDSNGITSKYTLLIDKSCTLTGSCLGFLRQPQALKDAHIAGAQDNQAPKILIHVTTEDIVIRMQSLTCSEASFIIKNDSPASNRKFCYFVSDSGRGDVTKRGDTSTGWAKPSFTWNNTSWMDYDTYVALYDSSVLSQYSGGIIGASKNSNFRLNTFVDEMTGTHKPNGATTIFFITNGCTWKGDNDSFIQGIYYGPESKMDTATQGISLPYVCKNSDRTKDMANFSVCTIGMVIAGDFQNNNASYYVFNAPAEGGALDIVQGARTDELYGYKLLRYDHH